MPEVYQAPPISEDIIRKKYQRGMDIQEIAMLYQLKVSYIKEVVEGVARTERRQLDDLDAVKPPSPSDRKLFFKGKVDINYIQVEELVSEGYNLKQIAKRVGVNYATFCARISTDRPDLSARASARKRAI